MSAEPLATRLRWAVQLAAAAPLQGSLPYSRRRIERSAGKHLRRAVDHAYRYVPHYREVFDARGLRPEDFQTEADLARLPILEREELQADPVRFISTHLPRERLIRLRTGGSSGRPAAIYHDPESLFKGAAQRERRRRVFLRAAGRRVRLRELRFETEQSSGGITAQEFSRRSLIPRAVRVVTESRSMLAPLEESVREIERLEPDLVSGYGSYLEALMDHIEDRGGASHLPAVLAYGGDGMSERSRRSIPERFGIPVFSAYGAVEVLHLAFECEAHRGHHVNTDLYPVRIVDRAGEDVPVGTSGDVVVSNLVTRGTVLLNYRLGDVARWTPGPCPCGRELPVLSYVEGRTDDWLELPGGELLHPQGLRGLFTVENEYVRSYQIEQLPPPSDAKRPRGGRFSSLGGGAGVETALLLRIVPAPGADADARAELAARLTRKVGAVVGDRVGVEVQFVAELPRTARGKVRTVLSPRSRRRWRAASGVQLRPADPDDLDAILAVMEPANMHRIDSPEMPPLELDRFVIAELDGEIVGAAGWELLEPELAKTTLLAVLPEARGRGIGEALQRARMDAMARAGARRVRTNADRPETIAWYKREFGYEEVGTLPKEDDFGDPGIDAWTTLEAPLPTVDSSS